MTEPFCGFDGKLPSRGDFVSRGLSRAFLAPWQGWLDAGLAASRASLGETWLAAWLEAPVWYFSLAAGVSGTDAVLGLLMPSVDQAGRHYPLTVAVLFPDRPSAPETAPGLPWLAAVEAAARAALANDHTPDALMQAIEAAQPPDAGAATSSGLWWTAGSPRVPAQRIIGNELPPPARFVAMIDAAAAG